MKKTIAALGLSAALVVPGVAMATTADVEDTDDTTVECPYDGVCNQDGTGAMFQNRGQERSRQATGDRDGTCDGTGAAEGFGHGYGSRDGSGPIQLQDGTGSGYRHGANR